MWRLVRRHTVGLRGRRPVATTAAAGDATAEAPTAHPILFDVPAIERAVGRDTELMSLWQSLLSGRRVQAITGPDGIGKSTLAAEFCERARRSGRFTCIQWMNGRESLQANLFELARSMKDRKEKDVLLVVDDVPDPQEALRLLPGHEHFYALLTSSVEVDSTTALSVLRAQPLLPDAAEQFSLTLEKSSPALSAMLRAVGHVPLLVHVACSLVDSGAATPEEIQRRLRDAGEDGASGALHVSRALRVLLDMALTTLSAEFPHAARHLAVLSYFDTGDISPAVIQHVVAAQDSGCSASDGGDAFGTRAVELGICAQRFDDAAALTIHPLVARLLRDMCDDACAAESAAVLHALWPRRWRGTGSRVARELVRHTRAVLAGADARSLPALPGDLLHSLDRSATLLALGEGRELPTAAELWLRVVRDNEARGRRDVESVRVARECGRVLHFLRDARAAVVLRAAFGAAAEVHGRESPEAALVLGFYAPYIAAGQEAVAVLRGGVAALESRLASVDAVLGREEARMMLETIFVLLVRQGQVLEEMGERTPERLWTDLQNVSERIEKSGGGQN